MTRDFNHPAHGKTENKSLTHTSNDKLSPSDILIEFEKIKARLDKDYTDKNEKEKLINLLQQLSEFELGRFLIKNKGALSGYWTYYIIIGFSKNEITHPLEKAILETAPTVLATRERFHIFQKLLQKSIRTNSVVCSIPCGAMADLLTLNIPDNVENVRFVGIDLDQASIDLAKAMAQNFRQTSRCEFFKRDAWQLDLKNAFDVITTNGLNIYEGSDKRVIDLYTQLYKALKPGGKLIGSALSCPPLSDQLSEWDLSKTNMDALNLQKAVFLQILQATWSHFRSSSKTIEQLKAAGFQSVEIIWDTAKIFYSFEATKNTDTLRSHL